MANKPKKLQIYKKDKWNMVNVEVRGREVEVIEISDQWGEDSRTFYSRPELMHWVHERFAPDRFDGPEEERIRIIGEFEQI
jgi:hypothetical protein